MAPVSLKPSSRAPLLDNSTKRVYFLRIGGEILCQPTQASISSSGLVLLARTRLRSLRERHFSLPSGCGLQYLPLPYAPSIQVPISVSSLRSASLFGAG